MSQFLHCASSTVSHVAVFAALISKFSWSYTSAVCKSCRKAESLFLQTWLFRVVFSSTFQPFCQFCRTTGAPSAAIVSPMCLVLQFCRLSVLLSRQVPALYTVEQFCSLSVLQQTRADHQVRSECCYHCSFIVVLESNDWSHNRTWNARTASVKTSPIQVFIGYKTLIEPC